MSELGQILEDGSRIKSNGIEFKCGGEPEKARWWNRLFCFFGYHAWVWSLEKYGVCFDKIPDGARCEYCNKRYVPTRIITKQTEENHVQ